MKKHSFLGLFFFLILLLAGTLGAQAAVPEGCMQGDADRDGAITCGEAKSFATERFTGMDRNGNHRLNMDEMEAGMGGIYKAMDTDRSGLVDVQEYVSYWCGVAPTKLGRTARGNKQPQFRKMDTNRDAKVSQGECVALWTVRFRDADDNRDGNLTAKEYVQSVIIWFADMDPNRDSEVTAREWSSYWIGSCQAAKPKKSVRR